LESACAGRYEICDQLFGPVIFVTHRHQRFTHCGVLPDDAFDLSQLDSEAANLDLMIGAADILDIAVFKISADITRLVQPRATAVEWIRYESLRCEVRTTEIAPGNSGPADVELTADADRDGFESLIQNVQFEVRNPLPDDTARHLIEIASLQEPVRDMDRRFRDSVHVHQRRTPIAVPFEPRLQSLQLERFTAEHNRA
jgi:hypothetical protein